MPKLKYFMSVQLDNGRQVMKLNLYVIFNYYILKFTLLLLITGNQRFFKVLKNLVAKVEDMH